MFKKIVFSSVLLASAISAQAAGSAPFGVTGTITPAACDVTLTGGVVNLGVVSTVAIRNSVVAGPVYRANSTSIPFNITCSAATRVEVSFVDNQAGKTSPIDGNDVLRFGVVDGTGTTAIGSYQFHLSNVLIDGAAVGQFLATLNGATSWIAVYPSNRAADFPAPGYTTGFAKTAGATAPDSLTTLSGSLDFALFLNIAYVNSATNSITPSGSGTLSLVYL